MWRSLTSMGTALVLLFLLALAAIPGALLPQRGLNAAKVDDYLAAHPLIGPWLDELQAFDVFSSFWFTAIYVLLFVSLVGCLAPRTIEHARSLRATPVAAPRNLARLPKHAHARLAGEPAALAATITGRLRGWRSITRQQGDSVEVSAEKGYLREFGNLVFHFALLGLLVAVAVGKLFGYEGNVIVIADGGPGLFGVAGRVRLVSRRQHRRRHVVAPDLCAGQQLPSALPAVRAGHLVRRRHRLSGRPGHC